MKAFSIALRAAVVFGLMLIGTGLSANAWSVSSEGRHFVFAFQPNLFGLLSLFEKPEVSLHISSSEGATGYIRVPGLGLEEAFSVAKGEVTKVALPIAVADMPVEAISPLAVYIDSSGPVSVYGLNSNAQTSDAFMALPAESAGTDYMLAAWFRASGQRKGAVGSVVALYDNTEVTVSPTFTSPYTYTVREGVPYTVTLNAGEVYTFRPLISASGHWLGEWDFTGTRVTSTAPITLMGGAVCAQVPFRVRYCDHLTEQIPPISNWGRQFITVPSATRPLGDVVRVLASEDDTAVYLNGEMVAVLASGQLYDTVRAEPLHISTSAPSLVVQYAVGAKYDGAVADPFMMVVPPVEQYLNSYTFMSMGALNGFDRNFINVVVPDEDISTVVLDGEAVDASAFSPIDVSGYSGAQVEVVEGSHSITSAGPVGLFVYGFGEYDSYGYPGGMNFDLINPRGDNFPPTLNAAHFDDRIMFVAGDSEDINLNQILDDGEDLNVNGVIDRRSEDVNGNGELDAGEDLNGDGVIDRDTGIYRVTLSSEAENLVLDTSTLAPGALRTLFGVSRIDPSAPARGRVTVQDGAGNAVSYDISFESQERVFRDVRLVSTVSTDALEIDRASFTVEPTEIRSENEKTVIEWVFDRIALDELQAIDYDLVINNARPGEQRVVTQGLEVWYSDHDGKSMYRALGEQTITVLPSAIEAELSASSLSATSNQDVALTGMIRNLGQQSAIVSYSVDLLDDSGAHVRQISMAHNVLIAGNDADALPEAAFNTGDLYVGSYRLRLSVEDGGVSAPVEVTIPFEIVTTGQGIYGAHVASSSLIYQPGDTAAVTARVSNLAQNQMLEDASAQIRVEAPDGNLFWAAEKSLPVLGVAATYDFDSAVVLGGAAPGVYSIYLDIISSAGERRASSQYMFEVLSTQVSGAGIQATLGLQPPQVLRTERAILSATVRNTGNDDVSAVPMQVQIADVASEQTLASLDMGLVSLQQGQQQKANLTWTANAPAKGIAAILLGEFAGEGRVLGSQLLSLQEKFFTTVSPHGKGRIIALVDAAPVAGKHCKGLAEATLSIKTGGLLMSGDDVGLELRGDDGAVVDSESVRIDHGLREQNQNQSLKDEMTVLAADAAGVYIGIFPGAGTSQLSGANYSLHYSQTRQGVPISSGKADFSTACSGIAAGQQLTTDVSVAQVYGLDQPEPHDPREAPGTLEQQKALQSMLEGRGWRVDIVSTDEDLERALSRDRYSVALLLSEQVKLDASTQALLAERVQSGLGLVVAGMHDNRNKAVVELAGVKLTGVHTGDLSVRAGTGLSDQSRSAELAFSSTPLRIRLDGSEPVAEFLAEGDIQGVAATRHTEGLGQTVFFAFDLLQEHAANNAATEWGDWLHAALESAHPASGTSLTGQVTHVTVEMENVGTATYGEILLQLPANIEPVDAGGGQVRSNNTLYRALALPADVPATWTFSIRLPEEAGPVQIPGTLRVIDADGALVDYGPVQGVINAGASE